MITSKLIDVFPKNSDELDLEEIEHASSLTINDDSSDYLFGSSKIIPNLELHENIDFTPLLEKNNTLKSKDEAETNFQENELIIEPIIIEFKLEDDDEIEVIDH